VRLAPGGTPLRGARRHSRCAPRGHPGAG
jgi:hypothetical protein